MDPFGRTMPIRNGMPILLAFLKHPTAGQVKTRLAKVLGAEVAANLYRDWVSKVFDRLEPLRGSVRIVACYTGGSREDFAQWLERADDWWPQPDGELGERLQRAFECAHATGGAVVAIGTDCLDVDADLLRTSFDLLTDRDVVFGPALDGGYYLVGTARLLPEFFVGVPWSDAGTLAAHLAHCQERGWTVGTLTPLRDIDTAEDWLAYQAELGRKQPAGISENRDINNPG